MFGQELKLQFTMRYLITLVLLAASSFANAADLQAGQVWAYTTRTGENESTLTVLKIEQYRDLGQVVHVRIDGIRMRNPVQGNIITDLPHLPFRGAAIQRSVTKLLRNSSSVPDFKDGYDTWKQAYDAGKAGAFETDVATTLNALLGASWKAKD